MQTEILTTKFFIPPFGPNIIHRPRLVERLNQEAGKKLILLSAPAGYGKTTLLSQWICQSEDSFCWLALDSTDNDLDRFLAYVIASLQSAGMPVEREILDLRQSSPQASHETVLIPLINQIAAGTERVSLVLDDYHKIQAQAVHEAVAYLLDHLPVGLRLIIATRSDPPLPTARLRARGELGEIRVEELRFTDPETTEFLGRFAHLAPAQLQALASRTEGWIAGLQLFSLSMRGRENLEAYLESFSGTQEHIADFLATEVLNLQEQHVRDFLVQTSILERFCAPLCEEVTGLEDCAGLLKNLKEDNVFLIPLDEENNWFRYHHLFADLLHQRLLKAQPGRIPTIYLNASRWFHENGYISEAVEYALRGRHFDQAAALIDEQAEKILIQSEIATFLGWVQQLPKETVRKTGQLSLYYAWALLICRGGLELAAQHLSQFKPRNDLERGKKYVVQSMLSAYHRNTRESIARARKALEQLPPEEMFFRQIAAWNLSAGLFLQGDHESGYQMLEEIARVSRANNNSLVAVIALTRMGAIQFQKGRLEQAQGLFERAVATKPQDRNRPLPAASEALMYLGKVYWERFEADQALLYLERGLGLSSGWSVIPRIDAFVTQAQIQQLQGDSQGARDSLSAANEIAVKFTPSQMDERYVATQKALIDLREGDLSAVEEWIQACELDSRDPDLDVKDISQAGRKIILAYELIVSARYLLTQQRSKVALGILDKLRPPLEMLNQQLKVFEVEVLSALAHYQSGNIKRAVSVIDSVLNAAGTLGCKRVFWAEGPALAGLMKRWYSAGHHSQTGLELLASFSGHAHPSSSQKDRISGIDPLSERECEVLRLLESELSVPEISELLHIATSTLRTHVKNIYSKLDVHSRFEALSKARELGLL